MPGRPGASWYGTNSKQIEEAAKEIMRRSEQESERMRRAEEEFEKGNVAVAYRLYGGVASSRQATDNRSVAKERMASIREKGQEKCDEIDARLSDLVERMNNVSEPDNAPAAADEEIKQIFEDFKQLVKQYQHVSSIGSSLVSHVARQRARPECAAVLNESQAAELWKLGQEHEENGQLCCAYRVYEKAGRLMPAASARTAQARLSEMKKDPKIVKAAKTCAELEWCHRTYQRAEKLVEANRERAQELFAEVVARSPADSEVHREAAERLEKK